MNRKNLAIITLTILLITSGIGNIILGMPFSLIKSFKSNNVLRIACSEANSPVVLDPVDSWDDVSNDIIRHVCDTLWVYDLTEPTFPLEMRLATSYSWNAGMDELTVSLRDDVWFHNGAKFNASAVKFTFDRILYFINSTGNLPGTTHVCDPAVFFFDMLRNPILNKTEIIDEYTVKFMLNKPNGVFLSLLTYEACSILHPNSANAIEYLRLGEDKLIGTGPFEYIHFKIGVEIRFERWNLYWGDNVFWDTILWTYYSDVNAANDAFLDGKVEYLYNPSNSFIPTFKAEEDIVVLELNASPILRYWAFNNERVNDSRIRKAMAYAYNTSYFIEIFRENHAVKAEQLLPLGFPYYNESFQIPYYNTTIARQAMMDAFPNQTAGLTAQPYGENATNDAIWSVLKLAEYRILEHEGWTAGRELNQEFINDMKVVGIKIVRDVLDWEIYWPWEYLYERSEIWYSSFGPNYPDPFNMLEPLLNNITRSNPYYYMLNSDYLIHKWLKEYEETDPVNTTRRAQLLYKIQQRAINELYLFLPQTFDKIYNVHYQSLGGLSYNIMNKLWLTNSYYIPGS